MDKKQLKHFYYQMLLMREFEDRCAEWYQKGEIGGFLHLYTGQEAVAVGAIGALDEKDHVITHYRDHGHAIAKEIDPKLLMAELFGRVDGVCKGKGGSMHLADVNHRMWGGYAIVGGHMPLAVGMALASQYEERGEVVLCIFGDGATNIGEFHEALNLAGVWKLPVVFLCENNLYGMGTELLRASAVEEIHKKACAYGMPGESVDGMDVLAVYETMSTAAERARSGDGPTLVEALTYRYAGHSIADPQYYRDRDEIREWREQDPIGRFEEVLTRKRVLTKKQMEELKQQVEDEMDEVVEFALNSSEPPPEALWEHIYADTVGREEA